MNKVNAIGLHQDKAENLAKKRNELLANYSFFYLNTRDFHWKNKGEKFFELHLKSLPWQLRYMMKEQML